MQTPSKLSFVDLNELIRLLKQGGMPELFHRGVVEHVERCVLDAEVRAEMKGINKASNDVQSPHLRNDSNLGYK